MYVKKKNTIAYKIDCDEQCYKVDIFRVFLRHRRSENFPFTLQNSPADVR